MAEWEPIDEFIAARGRRIQARYYGETDKLTIGALVPVGDNGMREQRIVLSGDELRKAPQVLRVLRRVLDRWERQLGEEQPSAFPPKLEVKG